jgi:predicted lipoprotein with Yx(FWY)xxD motif
MNMFNGRRLSALAGLALAGVLALAACSTGTGGAYGGAGSTTTSGSSSTVNLNCASGATVCTKTVMVKGQSKTVLATTSGMTLYYFTPDTATAIACAGSCAQQWPPLTAAGGSVTGTNLSGALSTVNGANGVQVIYNGHPLYTYGDDKAQTDAKGEGELGKWFVATPDLAAASGGSAPASSPSSTGGYGGY